MGLLAKRILFGHTWWNVGHYLIVSVRILWPGVQKDCVTLHV